MPKRLTRRLRSKYKDEIVQVRALAAMGFKPFDKLVLWDKLPVTQARKDLRLAKKIHDMHLAGKWPPEPYKEP